MERITSKDLERKALRCRAAGLSVSLDHHQPGDAKRTWAVETVDGAVRLYSYRMTATECHAFLSGLLWVLDNPQATNARVWLNAEQIERAKTQLEAK